MRLPCTAFAFSLVAAACTYHGTQSNGLGGALEFTMEANSTTAGTQLPFHLRVDRIPPQWSCQEAQPYLATPAEPGALHPQGGNIPCPASTPQSIALLGAHCDGDACVVSDDSSQPAFADGSVHLRVTPAHAGSLTLHVSVRATDGSGSWNDTYAVSVVDVDRLAWQHTLPDDAPASVAVPVGTPAAWTPLALAADATKLAATDDAFDTQWQGDAFAVGQDGVARAQKPGPATLTLTAAGKTKTETLRVFDPSEVRTLEVQRAANVPYASGSPPVDVEAGVSQGASLSAIAAATSPDEAGPFVLVLTLADGTRALGGAHSLAITGIPVTVDGTPVQPEVYAPYAWTFWISGYTGDGSAPDGGAPAPSATLNARVGQATLALPLALPSSIPDAGRGD
ncbi:MAG TPA: hypothetical protein VGI39_24230 [Polyangiaceae bacterium]|jgi:hypothetical protein